MNTNPRKVTLTIFLSFLVGILIGGLIVNEVQDRRSHTRLMDREMSNLRSHLTALIRLRECDVSDAIQTLDLGVLQTQIHYENPDHPDDVLAERQPVLDAIGNYFERFNVITTSSTGVIELVAVPEEICNGT